MLKKVITVMKSLLLNIDNSFSYTIGFEEIKDA